MTHGYRTPMSDYQQKDYMAAPNPGYPQQISAGPTLQIPGKTVI